MAVIDIQKKAAYQRMFDIGNMLGAIITNARAQLHPLQLPSAVIDKLSEAQQAVFAAQRLLEKEMDQ